MNKIHFQVLVAELVHEVLELHELVPGAADAHQEHDVVALVGHAVGDLGHLLACLDGCLAVGEVALLVEVYILDLLGLPHCHSPFGPMAAHINLRVFNTTYYNIS